MRYEFSASPQVRALIDSLGRTEDVRFSPSNSRLAVAAHNVRAIAVFEIELGEVIELRDGVLITCDSLKMPHGVDFLDEDRLIVADRQNDLIIVPIPSGEWAGTTQHVEPLGSIDTLNGEVGVPSSVTVLRKGGVPLDVLVCDNSRNSVIRCDLDPVSPTAPEIFLKKWFDIPDGVAVSPNSDWIAVSNHEHHDVLLFRNDVQLRKDSEPTGIAGSVNYPHGLRFTADNRFLLVADAGAPYVHVYRTGSTWVGMRQPASSVRVLSDDLFHAGRANPMEGGPKGMDISNDGTVMVTTCEMQPLAFDDLRAILQTALSSVDEPRDIGPELARIEHVQRLRSWLTHAQAISGVHQARAATAEAVASATRATLDEVLTSRSWRITAPLRAMATLGRRREV
ncbi:hypothetical protein [Smaragdicoccus niigatensis]|uniref:hypothetical protein n=1 Tax=Smaragdicoccus niigatensis TaxID=359359 RepID=UPI00037DA207|nr:hypothetical protein [Smaragdicoccus niigatensis]